MNRWLIIKLVAFLCCSSIWAQDSKSLYPYEYTKNCAFPFNYNDEQHYDCITDANNGDIPWCSLTQEYKGLTTYCTDYRKTTLQCVPFFTMPDGKNYTGCAVLSAAARYPQCRTNNTQVRYRYCSDALSSPTVASLVHKDTCDKAYADLAEDHTMCYGPSPYANVAQFTDAEKQGLLDIHNQYRANVTSRYMFKLYWNNELAKIAQAHANLCFFEHDQAINRVSPQFGWLHGQNIVWSNEIRSTPASLFNLMFGAEKKRFAYGSGCTEGEASCLHYTQTMISNITHVGCAQSHCVYPDRVERLITCNYLLSQYEDNFMTPYVESDTPAADCPKKNSSLLCDCGDTICRYDEYQYLDPATCTCQKSTSKRSISKRDVNDAELEAYTPAPPELRIPEGEQPPASKSKRGLTIPLDDVNLPEITKRHINDEELEQHVVRQLKIPLGATSSRSMEKRALKSIKLNSRKKRQLLSMFKI